MTGMRVAAATWAAWHAAHASWCDPTRCTSHTVRLNGPDLVNGRPAGPLAVLSGAQPAEEFATEQAARAARFRALVDDLLAEALGGGR